MEFVFPAIFDTNNDGSYTITFPDLPGCISEGKSLPNALYMAEAALMEWLEYLTDKSKPVPKASSIESVKVDDNQFVNLIRAEVKNKRAIKRTVSIPKWMDDKASEIGLSLSRVLQEALVEKLT